MRGKHAPKKLRCHNNDPTKDSSIAKLDVRTEVCIWSHQKSHLMVDEIQAWRGDFVDLATQTKSVKSGGSASALGPNKRKRDKEETGKEREKEGPPSIAYLMICNNKSSFHLRLDFISSPPPSASADGLYLSRRFAMWAEESA